MLGFGTLIYLIAPQNLMLAFQLQVLEKQQILEFEGHLAAATSKVTITEANSHLLDQLTLIDPV